MRLHIAAVVFFANFQAAFGGDRVSSEPVSLGNGDYCLVSTVQGKLELHWRSDSRDVQQQVAIFGDTGIAKGPLDVVDISLARWGRASLVAVVQSRIEDEDTFTFLVVNEPGRQGVVKAFASEAFRCEKGYRVLALSGNRGGDAITVVAGRMSKTRLGGVVESGKIVFHGCPNPGPINGRIGSFEAEYDEAEDRKLNGK